MATVSRSSNQQSESVNQQFIEGGPRHTPKPAAYR
jgi:hypothetical protein